MSIVNATIVAQLKQEINVVIRHARGLLKFLPGICSHVYQSGQLAVTTIQEVGGATSYECKVCLSSIDKKLLPKSFTMKKPSKRKP
jgi:hypothetical protein